MSIQIGERNGTRPDYKFTFQYVSKSNNEKINMQLTIDKLTAELDALKKEDKKATKKNEE